MTDSARAYLTCSDPTCSTIHPKLTASNRCSVCGDLLELRYDFSGLEPEGLRQRWSQRRSSPEAVDRSGVWRYRELLPSPGARPVVSLGEGSTPLLLAERTATWAGVARLEVKQQGGNPTGSFKDTGMTVVMTQALISGATLVGCASTGNTSSSMAAYAARAGLRAVLFIPRGGISNAKLAQALDFGARVLEAGDSFDQAFALLNAVAAETEMYLVNSINPYRIEGQKTVAIEVLEQRQWRVPDFLVVPGGNLGNVSALGKGLLELRELGIISRLPQLVVVQVAGASPFFDMVQRGSAELIPNLHPTTRATAIRIGSPTSWRKALRVIQASEGLCESVTDLEIAQAKAVLASDGVGCEPASAAAVAGIHKLRHSGRIEPEAEVVAVLTGHQLKDTDYILEQRADHPGQRAQVEPTVAAALSALQAWRAEDAH